MKKTTKYTDSRGIEHESATKATISEACHILLLNEEAMKNHPIVKHPSCNHMTRKLLLKLSKQPRCDLQTALSAFLLLWLEGEDVSDFSGWSFLCDEVYAHFKRMK